MILRDYQRNAVDEVIGRLDERCVLVAPTGAGKTVMGASLVAELGVPTLWLAHRRELIAQAAEKLRGFGLRTGLILAGQRRDRNALVHVASVQTLIRRQGPRVELIVVDECHHATASTYKHILAQYPGVPVVGLTATPFRTDGKGLGDVFGELIVASYTDELVAAGTLVEPTVYAPDAPSMKGVRIRAGEYDEKAIAEVMNKPRITGNIVETWLRLAEDRRTVCFAVNVAHSQAIVAAFREKGVLAEHVDGSTHPRARGEILARLRSGLTRVVSNCAVLTEGWDLPSLEVAILARPTASLCMHLQTIGRVMRAAPEKTGALVLDHAGNHLRHGLVSERIEYSLTDRIRQRKGKGEAEPRTKRCPACFLIVSPAARLCASCGHEFFAEVPEEQAGELVEFNGTAKRPPIETQATAWAALQQQATHWNWPESRAKALFRARFGFWPEIVGGRLVEKRDTTKLRWARKDDDALRREFCDDVLRLRAAGKNEGAAFHRFIERHGVKPPWRREEVG